jgi:hypothetical protein
MLLIICSVIFMIVMVAVLCVYSIRSLKDESVYGNAYYNDSLEHYNVGNKIVWEKDGSDRDGVEEHELTRS